MQPMQPWQQPPPKKDSSTLIVVGVIVGFFLLLGAVMVVLALVGFMSFRARAKAVAAASVSVSAASAAASSGFPEAKTTVNGLVTLHYPSDFAAKSLDDSTMIVSRNFGGGEDEVVTVGALESPITDDPHELGRILIEDLTKHVRAQGGTYTKETEVPAKCLGRYKGVEVTATFVLPPVAPYLSKSCFFMIAKRGYELRYDVPKSRLAKEQPLLESIEAAVEFH